MFATAAFARSFDEEVAGKAHLDPQAPTIAMKMASIVVGQ